MVFPVMRFCNSVDVKRAYKIVNACNLHCAAMLQPLSYKERFNDMFIWYDQNLLVYLLFIQSTCLALVLDLGIQK